MTSLIHPTSLKSFELLQANKHVLELMAKNRPLNEVLNSIVELIQTFAGGCLSTAYFVTDGKLRLGAAPAFPKSFVLAVDGCFIGHNQGTCGHAAFHGKRAISTNVEVDEVWGPFRDWILSYGIKAAWSTPVLDDNNNVIATVSMCWQEPKEPTDWDFEVVDAAASLMRIAVERERQNEMIEDQRLQLHTNSRLAALGEMTANLAHEINNPMSVILGRSNYLRRLSTTGQLTEEKLNHCIAEIEQTSFRITRIIKGLRAISKDGDNDALESVDVGTLIQEVLSFCTERFRMNGIDLIYELPVTPIRVECRHVQISQALLNLVSNSFDAVVVLTEKWVSVDVLCENNQCKITVTDSGKGIDPKIANEVLRPFFTTKKGLNGTGLGLSIANKIMSSHNGTIELMRDLPNTTFVLTLPLKQNQK